MWCDPLLANDRQRNVVQVDGFTFSRNDENGPFARLRRFRNCHLYDRPAFEQDLGLQGHTGWINYRSGLLVAARDRALLEDSCHCCDSQKNNN